MLFSIDEDVGGRVEGWVMPDNPAVTPRVVVHLDAEHHVAIDAFVYRPLLKQYGLHNTGVCGFVLDENNCPGLTTANKLQIFDADSHLLLYRRRPDTDIIDKKLFRLEPQLFRSGAVDDLLLTRFHMGYPALDLLPEETIRSILALPFTQSIYSSGRVFWRVWEPLLRDRGYMVGMLLRDPFHELAERLLVLKLASSSQGGGVIDAVGPVVEAAAGHLRNIDLKDFAELEALLTAAPIELRAILNNPLTHQLTAQNAFDPPPMPATAVALESLADMDAVGLRNDSAPFFEIVSAMLELPEGLSQVSLPTSNTVIQWADFLRERPTIRRLIELDLEVYRTAADIIERSQKPAVDLPS
jgi:hypothetical protein